MKAGDLVMYDNPLDDVIGFVLYQDEEFYTVDDHIYVVYWCDGKKTYTQESMLKVVI